MKRLVAAATAVVLSGCSFALVRRAPTVEEPMYWPKCTEPRLFPLGDAIYGALFVALSVSLLQSDDDLAPLGLIFSVPTAIGFGAGAYYGFRETSRCIRAREAYEKAASEGR